MVPPIRCKNCDSTMAIRCSVNGALMLPIYGFRRLTSGRSIILSFLIFRKHLTYDLELDFGGPSDLFYFLLYVRTFSAQYEILPYWDHGLSLPSLDRSCWSTWGLPYQSFKSHITDTAQCCQINGYCCEGPQRRIIYNSYCSS